VSRGVNKVILVGNLGNDPETRYMPDGNAVTSITVATSESWKDKNTGEQKEKTEWHRCSAFGKLAEIMGQYLRKGSKVYIEGSLQTRTYDKEGQKHYATEIKVRDMQMLDSKGQDNQPSSQQSAAQSPANNGPEDFDSDSIPF